MTSKLHPPIRIHTSRALAALLSITAATSLFAEDDILATAKDFVAKASAKSTEWTGPTTGPTAQSDKTIVYVSSDQRNSGVTGVADGAKEAAKVIGWNFRVIDGRGSVEGRGQALSQAIALKPSAIIVGGFDATEQAQLLSEAQNAGITVAGWHCAADSGPVAEPKIFTNVGTAAKDTAQAAAYLALAQSDGKANVVIFTDSAFTIALAKSDAMAEIIKQCKTATLLETRIQSLATATKDMPQITASLLQKYGKKWNYSLGINDLYFDGMVPGLAAAGVSPSGQVVNISAGDGSLSAYQRIQGSQYQDATIPEPLHLHGWQLVDELNRAFAGQSPSGFNSPVHIVTPENVQFDGGDKATYDPQNGYRDAYKKIWGV